MDVVAGLIQKCINENAVKAEYISRYNSLVERHEKAQNRYDTIVSTAVSVLAKVH